MALGREENGDRLCQLTNEEVEQEAAGSEEGGERRLTINGAKISP